MLMDGIGSLLRTQVSERSARVVSPHSWRNSPQPRHRSTNDDALVQTATTGFAGTGLTLFRESPSDSTL